MCRLTIHASRRRSSAAAELARKAAQMQSTRPPLVVTPEDYELAVKAILDAASSPLAEYRSAYLQTVTGADGDYVIDVLATFSALRADVKALIKCKSERRRVERQDVQILKAEMDSTGSQKGMLFSIAGFQSGAALIDLA